MWLIGVYGGMGIVAAFVSLLSIRGLRWDTSSWISLIVFPLPFVGCVLLGNGLLAGRQWARRSAIVLSCVIGLLLMALLGYGFFTSPDDFESWRSWQLSIGCLPGILAWQCWWPFNEARLPNGFNWPSKSAVSKSFQTQVRRSSHIRNETDRNIIDRNMEEADAL
jgi:hypothetical protein